MADDEALALYGAVKKLAQAMAEREAALDARTAALDAAIAGLKQLPATLGQQTSLSIEKGVRASIREDLKWPVENAFEKPIEDLRFATSQAQSVMREVRSAAKLQGWIAVAVVFFVGMAVGMTSCYFFFIRDLGKIHDRLEIIQQQITSPAPAQPTASGKSVALAPKNRLRSVQEAPKKPGQAQQP